MRERVTKRASEEHHESDYRGGSRTLLNLVISYTYVEAPEKQSHRQHEPFRAGGCMTSKQEQSRVFSRAYKGGYKVLG